MQHLSHRDLSLIASNADPQSNPICSSASADAINGTTTIHRSSRGDRTRDRPSHQPDSRPHDAAGRIADVWQLTTALAGSMLATMQQAKATVDSEIESFIVYPHSERHRVPLRGLIQVQDQPAQRIRR